jgi:indolepyruvate ferredoxin oxidoreductase beta subunit
MKTINTILTGVGGQGILTLSRMMGNTAILADLDVTVSEVHGMAQRGGSVIVHLKVGEKIYSPLIPKQGADWIIGLEAIETYRHINYLDREGYILMDSRVIPPPAPDKPIPKKEELIREIAKTASRVYIIPAHESAIKLGNAILANTILFGAIAQLNILGIDKRYYIESMRQSLPDRYLEINLEAFDFGYKYKFDVIEINRR